MTNALNTIRRTLATFAVIGLGIFMLAACLGGSSGDSPLGQILGITPGYAAFAFDNSSRITVSLVTASSSDKALSDARNDCAQRLGSSCARSGVGTGCAAVAISTNGTGMGGAAGGNREEARRNAIASCEELPGVTSCRVYVDGDGDVADICF